MIICIAASLAIPPKPNDLFSLSPEEYFKSTKIGLNVFTAAKAAVERFRDPIHKDHPKAFIYTGNLLPFNQVVSPSYFTLGVQKTLALRLIATSSNTYEAEGFKFYYAHLVSKTGGIPNYKEEFLKSGKTHADVYWSLINEKKEYDYR